MTWLELGKVPCVCESYVFLFRDFANADRCSDREDRETRMGGVC